MPPSATTTTAPVLAALAALTVSSASAHHSWSAEYDLSRSTVVSGRVARVSIRYPHSAVLLDVAAADGSEERWTVEWASPERLRDRGVTGDTIRVGDALVVTGNPHRDADVRSLRAMSLRRDDGSEIGGRTPQASEQPRPGEPSH